MRFCTPSAIKAYEAMLDKVRAENSHLSEAELDKKLREARDEYCRKLKEDDRTRAKWVLDTAK
jgi:histidinol dehydrogenase